MNPNEIRRPTYDGDEGWIFPQFTWDPTNQFLRWTENHFPDGYRFHCPVEIDAYVQKLEALLSRIPPAPAPWTSARTASA